MEKQSEKNDFLEMIGRSEQSRLGNLKLSEETYESLPEFVQSFFSQGEPVESGFFYGAQSPADKAIRVLSVALNAKVDLDPQSKSLMEQASEIAKASGELVVEVGKSAKEFIDEHPIATTVVAGIVTGGAAYAMAAPIAVTIGSTGALGAASTGTPIATLKGAALASASLAKVGGGAIVAGGGGQTVGAAVIGVAGGATGASVSASVAQG